MVVLSSPKSRRKPGRQYLRLTGELPRFLMLAILMIAIQINAAILTRNHATGTPAGKSDFPLISHPP
jgi:hypothetical protein